MKIDWMLAAAAAAILAPAGAHAQAWPSKPVRWVVPFAPGGPTDVVSRMLGPKLSERVGVPVIIENRAGAAGNIGTDSVAKAAPDGHTILYVVPAVVTNPFFFKGSPDPGDLAPVMHISTVPMVLVAANSFAPKNVAEIIALARSKPGSVSCGSSGAIPTVGCELLRSYAQSDLIMVLYKGNGPALNALMGGEINLLFDVVSTSLPQVKAGRIRAVASMTPRRGIGPFADLPTANETVPGFELNTWHGMMAPPATPREIVSRLNGEMAAVLAQPEIRQRLGDMGFVIVASTPEAFDALLKRESASYAKILKGAGIKPE